MRRKLLVGLGLCAVVFAAQGAVELIKPADGETVPLLTEPQKAYVKLPLAERRVLFADEEFRQKKMGLPTAKKRRADWPQVVELVWKAKKDVACTVTVRDAKKGTVVFSSVVSNETTCVDNLEIAATYEWAVDDGEGPVRRIFKTEDMAPRLVRFPGVGNVRDIGGWKGLDGRRIRQGLVFRSAGLNQNASPTYYKFEELEAAGKMSVYEKQRAKITDRLKRVEGWRRDHSLIKREGKKDWEYIDYERWLKQHPDDSLDAYLDGRIAALKKNLETRAFMKIEKKDLIPGKSLVAGEKGEYIRSRFGIKTDIDLRWAKECYGMTGSPLGPTVAWHMHPSWPYGGVTGKQGGAAFKQVFTLFLDEKNYPIVFHCIAGQDRTGTDAYILEALLGVDEDTLALDWELSGLNNRSAGFNHKERYDGLVAAVNKYFPAPTVRERAEKFVLSLGFTEADIAKFRAIMLEP